MQSAWAFGTQPPHLLLCYTHPCVIVETLTLKEQVFCSNAYKQAFTIENEKSMNSRVNEAFEHKK
jgi:hypothetical protein